MRRPILLCFNTGLLSRQSSVPDWVSEGLATYVELWRNKQTRIGEPNVPWLSYLRVRSRQGRWIPIADLVADDKTFDDKTLELSYAESWLTVHYLMKSPQQLPKFRAYLAGLTSERRPPTASHTPRNTWARSRISSARSTATSGEAGVEKTHV